MASGRRPNEERRRRMAELRAQGLSDAEVGRLLGVSRQSVQRALRPRRRERSFRIRCRECDRDLNPAGAVPRDDRDVLCLSCLAKRPELSFGEHLKAFRLAAGLKVITLAERVGVRPSVISSYEHGRTGTPTWPLLQQLFRAVGVCLAVASPGGPEVSGSPAGGSTPAAPLAHGLENSVKIG